MSKFDFLDRFHKEAKFDVDTVALRDFASEIGGRIINTAWGNYLEIVTDYPGRFLHGVKTLQNALVDSSVHLDCFEAGNDSGHVDLAHVVFVDAETTGLSTAPGTVAFLIGIGEIVDGAFRVTQFFLPDYPIEPAMLEAVADLVDGKEMVVSFNGKAFDLPLLEARYVMQRLVTPFAGMHHIDLLHVSRRFWRGRFADNTLQTLEKELLGVYRQNDTPGYLIPQLYFEYLRTGEAQPLAGVLLHNRLDIVTLLFLMKTIERYLEDAARYDYYSPLDALVIAKHHCRRGDLATGGAVAARQFNGSIKSEVELSLGLYLYRTQKRLGRYDDALKTLTHLRTGKGETRLYAYEETAKILEHKLRDVAAAARIIAEAMEYLDNPIADLPYERILFWNETLQKRRQRLLKRIR